MRKHIITVTIIFFATLNYAHSETSIENLSENYCEIFAGVNEEGLKRVGTLCPLFSKVYFPNHFPPEFNSINLIDAFVIVKITVTKIGTARDFEVLDGFYQVSTIKSYKDGSKKEVKSEINDGRNLFRYAIKTIQHSRFKPNVSNGEPFDVENVIIKVNFK